MKPNARIDVGLLILRLGVGLTMLFFGSQKMLGVFGGPGYSKTIENFHGMGIPPALANLAIAAEFFGSLGILFGALTQVAAFGVLCTMGYAVYLQREMFIKASHGQGTAAQAAFFPLVMCLASLAVFLMGPGRFAVDAVLFGGMRGKRSAAKQKP